MDNMSFNRPRADDTEEDLLEFQRRFLESGLKPAVEVVKKRKSVPVTGICDNANSETTEGVDMDMDMEVDSAKKSRLAETAETVKASMDNTEAEMDAKDSHITSILTKITERNTMQMPIYFPSPQTTAFPLVHHRRGQNPKQKSKKSIFAQQFQKQSGEQNQPVSTQCTEKEPVKPCIFPPLPKTIPIHELKKLYPCSMIVSGSGLSSNNESDERRKIHKENLEKLSGMSEQEAIAERNKLLQEMSPQTIAFLRERSKLAKSKNTDAKAPNVIEGQYPKRQETLKSHTSSTNDQNEKPAELLTANCLHMDVVEPEKLAWTEEAPESNLKEIKTMHRFDFNGDIVKDGGNIPTHLGLHHHGEDPTLPGYTLQELFILSRSKFTQQRVLAITMLGKIIAKAKTGQFINFASENIIESLLEAGLLFLLRWSLDEQSETLLQAAIFALHSLICDPQNEDTLNQIFVSNRGCEHPSLCPGVKIQSDSSDHEIAQVDVVAGLVRMKILPRLRYVLEVGKPGPFVVGQCLDIIKRICRHSLQLAVAVYECPRLLRFVIHSLILKEGQYPPAVAMVRAVCTAGRHVSTRLLNDYKDVVTIIYKYIGGCCSNDTTINLHMEIEVWRLWITLTSYGLLPSSFRELFSVITEFLQMVAIKLKQQDQVSTDEGLIHRAQLVCKMCSIALLSATTYMSAWKDLTNQIEIISVILNKQLLQLSANSKVAAEMRVLYGAVLEYMTSYCHLLKNQTSVDITLITQFTTKTATPMLNHALKCIKLIKYPTFISTRENKIHALPRTSGLLDQNYASDFQLLVSYLRCCVSIMSLDKSICKNFGETATYLAEDCSWMVENTSVQTFLLRNRVYCLYWSIMLYLKLVIDELSENVKYSRFFFKVAFRCFSQLHDGDEHMMHHILSAVLFHSDLLKSLVNCSAATVADDMATLDMTRMISAVAPSPANILEATITTLPSIRATYLQSMTISSKILDKSKARYFCKFHEISSYLIPPCEESCAPSDWAFIPLLQLYDYSLNKSLPVGSVTHSINCLRYLCFVERYCKDCLEGVSVSAKLVRIMCVYIAGNDLFLEHPVRECLAFLLAHYCRESKREDLDFTLPIPGISSFFDFYLSLLEQYESVSFGDELFGAVALLPLHQLNGGIPDVKKALWCDRVDVLRLMGLPISKLLIPLSWYLYPIEDDIFMIRSYLRALASGNCSKTRCPVLYTIAVHHTSGFLFDKKVDVPVTQRREIYNGVLKLRDDVVRKHIFHYDTPISDDTVSDIGFHFTEQPNDARNDYICFLMR